MAASGSGGSGGGGGDIAQLTRALIPPFSSSPGTRKGQHGKVAVVGGSWEYTGAPYYAAGAALKTGADLVWVLCSEGAGGPIKAYSPEAIVLPALPDSRGAGAATVPSAVRAFAQLAGRLDSVVVGPGLGRDPAALAAAAGIVEEARAHRLALVLDGDALFLLAQQPGMLQGYTDAVLTPNAAEFARLWDAVEGTRGQAVPEDELDAAAALSSALGGVAILRKGRADTIVAGSGGSSGANSSGGGGVFSAIVRAPGSPRRCGGQGDVLAGATATFLAWARSAHAKAGAQGVQAAAAVLTGGDARVGEGAAAAGAVTAGASLPPSLLVAAARGASLLTRTAAQLAFTSARRSMTTPDLLARIGPAFDAAFPGTLYAEEEEGDGEGE